jgi:ribosome-binding factor A
MENIREAKVREQVMHHAAEFLRNEGNLSSLITVTNAIFNEQNNTAVIFFTVFPEDKEHTALEFAKRKRADFREMVKDKMRIRAIPFFDFAIDKGEKNRQLIDNIGQEAGLH